MLFVTLMPYFSSLSMEIGWSVALLLIYYTGIAAGLWKMFEKAGEQGWKALIPFYNTYILYKLTWQTKMFWIEIAVILGAGLLYTLGLGTMSMLMIYIAYGLSIVEALIQGCLCYNIALAYGHGFGYFIGIYLLDFIFYPIIGFGSSQYAGNRYERADSYHMAH